MRVLVCGGRDYKDRDAVLRALDRVHIDKGITLLIRGGARGADTLAEQWAESLEIDIERYPANWSKDGNAAGPIRNARMLTEGKPDLVVAFPGGRGTADMIRQAEAAGVPVWRVKERSR